MFLFDFYIKILDKRFCVIVQSELETGEVSKTTLNKEKMMNDDAKDFRMDVEIKGSFSHRLGTGNISQDPP